MDKTTQVVRQQIAAMGARLFEIGLFKPSAGNEGNAVMIPRTWDVNTLMRSVPWLRFQNADGRNIYVRPKGEHNLTLVDDLDAGSLNRMKGSGYAPAAVVETSPGNFQAWLKHPETLSREVSTLAARKLADDFGGDRGAADWRHFGRLAGFTNRKEKYVSEAGVYPFVKLIEASGLVYPEGARFIAAVAAEREAEILKSERLKRVPAWAEKKYLFKTIDEFRSNPRYAGDGTRIDLAFAIYALSHGTQPASVAAAIRSRDLSHKGDAKRQEQYVDRTLAKASRSTAVQR